MLLSKTCSYGIRASIHLAVLENQSFVSIKEIASTLKISFHFLTKILQILKKADIVESVKGPGGGVGLKKGADEISILDIIYAIDGHDIFDQCVLGLPGCVEETPCPMHHTWGVLRKDLQEMLKNETLKNLALQIKNKSIQLYNDC